MPLAMRNDSVTPDRANYRNTWPALLLGALLLTAAAGRAQDGMGDAAPWSDLVAPLAPTPLSAWPMPGAGQMQPRLPDAYDWPPEAGVPAPGDPRTTPARRLRDSSPWSRGRWPSPSPSVAGDEFQPDLTGIWRGSGGEIVEVQRNRARIWGALDRPCSCVFFLVGRRLIAYSPESDRVRKYWYRGGIDQFTLVDEAGNLLRFRRAR